MNRKRLTAALATTLISVLTVGCSSSGSGSSSGGGGDFRVGLVLDQTGVSAQIAGPTGAGIQAYIKHLNASGGVDGHKITIANQADSRSTPEGAQAAFQQVLQSNPVAVLGSINSLGIAAVVPTADSAKTPVLIGSAPDTLLVPPKPWLFTQVMTAASMVAASLSYLDQSLGGLKGKRIAVSAAASAYGDGYVAAFQKAAAEKGFTPSLIDRSALTLTTFATNAAKIKSSNADALLLLDVPSATPLIVKDLIAAGFHNPIVGYESASDPTIFKDVATPQYVSFRGAPVPPAGGEMAKAAAAAGVSGQANSLWFSYGWNEAAVLADALKHCGASCKGSDLISDIEQVQNFTPPGGSSFGPVSYSKDKHSAATTVQFYVYDSATKAEKPELKPISVG